MRIVPAPQLAEFAAKRHPRKEQTQTEQFFAAAQSRHLHYARMRPACWQLCEAAELAPARVTQPGQGSTCESVAPAVCVRSRHTQTHGNLVTTSRSATSLCFSFTQKRRTALAACAHVCVCVCVTRHTPCAQVPGTRSPHPPANRTPKRSTRAGAEAMRRVPSNATERERVCASACASVRARLCLCPS